jgi:hypothetical protein
LDENKGQVPVLVDLIDYIQDMKLRHSSIEKHIVDLKKELNDPNVNSVRRTYLIETLKLIDEYTSRRNR